MSVSRRAFMLVWFCLLQSASPVAAQRDESLATGTVNVQQEDLLAQPVGANWTSYNGDYTGRRYSSLSQITTGNVGQLREAWVFHPGNSQNLEVTPVVIGGVMFVTSANDVFALDAQTGRTLWHYARPVSSGLLDDAAQHKNRGVAVWQDSVYSETDDAHLLCLDASSGALRWDVQFADKRKQYGATSAPLVLTFEPTSLGQKSAQLLVTDSQGDPHLLVPIAATSSADTTETDDFTWNAALATQGYVLLTGTPSDAASLVVTVNGIEIPPLVASNQRNWVWLPSLNAVAFSSGATPALGDAIAGCRVGCPFGCCDGFLIGTAAYRQACRVSFPTHCPS